MRSVRWITMHKSSEWSDNGIGLMTSSSTCGAPRKSNKLSSVTDAFTLTRNGPYITEIPTINYVCYVTEAQFHTICPVTIVKILRMSTLFWNALLLHCPWQWLFGIIVARTSRITKQEPPALSRHVTTVHPRPEFDTRSFDWRQTHARARARARTHARVLVLTWLEMSM